MSARLGDSYVRVAFIIALSGLILAAPAAAQLPGSHASDVPVLWARIDNGFDSSGPQVVAVSLDGAVVYVAGATTGPSNDF